MLTIWAVDPSGVPRGALRPLTCKAVLRHNDVSTYLVELDLEDALVHQLDKGWSVVITDTGIRLSGAIRSFHTSVSSGNRTLEISGRDELHRLADRLVYPNPFRTAGNQDKARYDARGPAETVLKNLVTLNVAAGALAARRSPAFVVAPSTGAGAAVVISERFSTVLEVCQKISSTGNLTFTATREDSGEIVLRTVVPRDLSRNVRLLATGETKVEAPEATVIMIAGQGQGAERAITEHTRTQSWGHRVELFKDRRDTDEEAALDSAGTDALEETSEKNSASLTLQEGKSTHFGVDFRLGDTVSVELAHATISEQVTAAEITWDALGRTVDLTVGADNTQSTPRYSKKIQDLDARLRGLETI